MKIAKIHLFTFQRNGIAGEGFYVIEFDWRDDRNNESGYKFIATFESNNEDNAILIPSCRVLNPIDISMCWRGDNFGYAFAKKFKSEGYISIYDAKESYLKATITP